MKSVLEEENVQWEGFVEKVSFEPCAFTITVRSK